MSVISQTVSKLRAALLRHVDLARQSILLEAQAAEEGDAEKARQAAELMRNADAVLETPGPPSGLPGRVAEPSP